MCVAPSCSRLEGLAHVAAELERREEPLENVPDLRGRVDRKTHVRECARGGHFTPASAGRAAVCVFRVRACGVCFPRSCPAPE